MEFRHGTVDIEARISKDMNEIAAMVNQWALRMKKNPKCLQK